MTSAAATKSAPLVDSYARGATDVPLIEQTIGAFFADMVARQPEREALVSVHQGRRYTYAQLQTEAHRWAWGSPPATGWASGRTTTPNGC